MAMVEATLATELQNLTPTSTESSAITALVDAYATYAADAEAATPIKSTGIDLGKTAMASALSGMSASGAGLTIIPNAILAFWNGVAAGLATSFDGATAISAPPHATLETLFAATAAANTSGSKTLIEATEAIAADMHANAIVGGTVTTPGPTVTPII